MLWIEALRLGDTRPLRRSVERRPDLALGGGRDRHLEIRTPEEGELSGRTSRGAHALIVEGAMAMRVLQCMSGEGQKLERRIRSLREQRGDGETLDRRVSLVAGALAEAELEFSDWETLYRELLQVVVAARGGERLIEGALARRRARSGK